MGARRVRAVILAVITDSSWEKRDRYERIVGKVLVDESGVDCGFKDCRKSLDAGLAQIRDGLAWHYKQYEREQSPEDRGRYASAER